MLLTNWLKQYFYTENYLYRLFGIIVILLFLGVGLRNWLEYRTLNEEIAHTAYRDAKTLQEYFVSVRRIFNAQFINSGIELNHNTIGFLPVHAASLISDDFQKHTTQGMSVRNISERNRNPHNAPHPYEREAIEYFKQHKNAKELFREIQIGQKTAYFYAAPLKIESYCLMCHGKQTNAPKFIRETYTTGYDYQIGDIRGITSITVEKNRLLEKMQEKYKFRLVISSIIAITIIGLIFLMVLRARRIEKQMMSRLEILSFIDPLTQLCNRRKANEWMNTYHQLFVRYGKVYSLIMIDIDYFKKINDTFGHPVGDDVLTKFATILTKHIRKTDHAARWGGEEFLIILPQTNAAQAHHLADTLRSEISSYSFEIAGTTTASFGLGQVHTGESVDTFINRVDRALYKAKENGRNQVVNDN